jgi:glutaminyl-peptide cyclotransferase
MVLLDFVGNHGLAIRHEENSSPRLWRKLRSAAHRVGALDAFPSGGQGAVSDDHLPFLERGVPSIDLIDFDFPCWHRRCDDMSAVSERSVNAVGETIYELLRGL